MKVWTVEWSFPSNCDSGVTVWDSEDAANKQACTEILDDVQNWDFSDSDVKDCAKRINDYVANGDLKAAVREYNDWQAEQDYEYQQFFSITQRDIQTNPGTPSLILFDDDDDDCCGCDCCGNEDCGGDCEDDDCDDNEPFVATHAGATCRGPCGLYSEFAYADCYEGTFVCYQCKMMSQVFGGSIK